MATMKGRGKFGSEENVTLNCTLTKKNGQNNHQKHLTAKKTEQWVYDVTGTFPQKLESWCCGNAWLDMENSTSENLVWVTADGRHSIWTREAAAVERKAGCEDAGEPTEDEVPAVAALSATDRERRAESVATAGTSSSSQHS